MEDEMIEEEFNKKIDVIVEMFNADKGDIEALYEDIKAGYFLSDDTNEDLDIEDLNNLSSRFLTEDLESYEYYEFIILGILFRAALELYGTEEERELCNFTVERIQQGKEPELIFPNKVIYGDAVEEIKSIRCTCKKCGYTWVPITGEPPKVCPKCKSYNWYKA